MIKYAKLNLFLFIIFSTINTQSQNCFIEKFSNTIFTSREYQIIHSVYKEDEPVYNDSIKETFSVISGDIFIRNDLKKYSGEKDSLLFRIIPPKLYIIELRKEIVLTQGFFKEIIPAGNYNILLYWDSHFPIHHKLELKNKEERHINYYFGGISIF